LPYRIKKVMSPYIDKKVSFKEWRPKNGHAPAGMEVLPHGVLRPLKVNPRRSGARIEAELRRGRIVSAFENMTLLVFGPRHDSPEVHKFDEDMKHYNRRLA
jgi:hypothetical protein